MSAGDPTLLALTALGVLLVGSFLALLLLATAWADELRRGARGRRGEGWRLVWVRTEVRREVRP